MDTNITSSFNSLTLFESTISNATMLVASMSNTDLLSAWRISGQLQNKIVEVLDPRMSKLVEVAEEHSKCCSAPSSEPAALVQDQLVAVSDERHCLYGEIKQDQELRSNGKLCVVKKEEDFSESDDCMILEEVCRVFLRRILLVAT